MAFLPYGKQTLDEEDVQAVLETLRSDWLTTGPEVEKFEKCLAEKSGARYAVAMNSGTAALHAAYFAAGVGPGDEVITSPITFAATANAALYMGARPVFADIRKDTININPEGLEKHIRPRTKVIAPVDFAGHPADLDAVLSIARENGLIVVEDAAHSLGAAYKGRPVGSLADITIFSFHPVKHVTTGEGGAVVTNDKGYYEKMLAFRSHGIVREKDKLTEYHGPWYHEMQHLGYNYRLTDIQCALGISQLKKLTSFLEKRQALVDFYNRELSSLDIDTPVNLAEVIPAWHLYVIRLKGPKPPRREIYEELHRAGIGVQVHYLPVYWHPYYQELGYAKGLCPAAEDYYWRALSLPLFPSMSMDDANRVCRELKRIISKK
ncbi:UDP-4-amino-4,6-dideoxy-N-acetyl-beta-L-altrosamine transaminase [Pelotomaculum propionicicum]|uniref:UDP-4-amino-4, 6-dideoxy-N-acetyl-beta-L-altrosamine transaminase n=1 Tax=Pelotomaculum propionicicum TaxID=258475 RepID=UPI003B7E7CD9